MATKFITFLGIGSPRLVAKQREQGVAHPLGYQDLPHYIEGWSLCQTPFAQEAAIIASGVDFDQFIILITPESGELHRAPLLQRLQARGVPASQVRWVPIDSADQSLAAQQAWFHAILDAIDPGDTVVFDFTHGFRSVPIVLSTAISFLLKAKPFNLLHAFYTFVDFESQTADLVDLVRFYEINQWADALHSLNRSGDAIGLAQLAQASGQHAFPTLANDELVQALHELTRAIKDVDMNGVANRACAALAIVRAQLDNPDLDPAERRLLESVDQKFGPLARADSGKIDHGYFQTQLAFAEQMIANGLRMQAYTVMRELIGSIGILGAEPKYRDADRSTGTGRSARGQYAEPFFSMCTFAESKWSFPGKKGERVEEMRPLWESLARAGLQEPLNSIAITIKKGRNGLNHGWTSVNPNQAREPDQASEHLAQLREIIDGIERAGLLDQTG